MTVKNTFLFVGDDTRKSRPNLTGFFYVYENEPFIGEVHELVVVFGDDILTFFPYLNG